MSDQLQNAGGTDIAACRERVTQETASSAPPAPDDLVRRLRKVDPDEPGERTRWLRNPDGPEAADRIEALAALAHKRDCEATYERARADRLELLREADARQLAIAVEALDAMIVYTIQGQPGYRTHNGIAQAMPRKTERVVRKALAQIKGGRDAD